MVQRLIDLLQTRQTSFFLAQNDQIICLKRGYFSYPFAAAIQNTQLTTETVKKILKQQNTYFYRACTGIQIPINNSIENKEVLKNYPNYYATIATQPIDYKLLKSNEKRKFNKALNAYTVQRIPPTRILAPDGIQVTHQAAKRYKLDLEIEKMKIMLPIDEKFDDVVHYWGVFDANKTLVAYCWNYIFGTTEANYNTIRFSPLAFKNYVSYALFYTMNDYYINKNQFEYVNDGYKTLTQHSGIQDFLIHNMGFVPAPTQLVLHTYPALNCALKILKPCANIIKNDSLKALIRAQNIVNIQNKKQTNV